MTGLVPRDPLMLLLTVLAVIAVLSLTLALITDLVRWASTLGTLFTGMIL